MGELEETRAAITVAFNDGSEITLEHNKDYDTFRIDYGTLIISFGVSPVAIYAPNFWKSVIPHYK